VSQDDMPGTESYDPVERLLTGFDERIVMDVVPRDSSVRQLVGVVRALTGDNYATVDRFYQERLVTRRMADGLDNRHAVGEYLIAVHHPQCIFGDGCPFGDGVSERLCHLRLGRLHVDRNATLVKDVVLAAVVEVQMTIHDGDNVAFVDPVSRECFRDGDDARLVKIFDEAASGPDARVEEDDAIGVPNRVTEDLTTAVSESWMPVRKGELGEQQPLDPRGVRHAHRLLAREGVAPIFWGWRVL
jgi:hypothetical protein